jgi:cytochrome c-type biogenesis protein CcmF
VQRQTLTEASIKSRWNLDLFAALSNQLGEGRWSVRVQVRPLIDYIWYSAALMCLGGILAASDRRYRARAAVPAPPEGDAARAEPA